MPAKKKPKPSAKLATRPSLGKKVQITSAVERRKYCKEVLLRSLRLGFGPDFDKSIESNDIRILLNNNLCEVLAIKSEYEKNKLQELSLSKSCRSLFDKHFEGTMDVWVICINEPALRIRCEAGEVDDVAMAHRLDLRNGSVRIKDQLVTRTSFVDLVKNLRKEHPELGANELNPITLTGMSTRIQKLHVCEWVRQPVTCLTAPYRTPKATDAQIVPEPCLTIQLEEFKTWMEYKPGVKDMMNKLQQLHKEDLYLPPMWPYDEASCPFSAASMADLRSMLWHGVLKIINHIARVLELGFEYNTKSAYIIMQKSTETKHSVVSKNVVVVVDTWPVLKTDALEGRSLWDLCNDPELGQRVRPVLSQLMNYAELEGAPLGVLASNRVVFFIKFPQDARNKTLMVSPPFFWNDQEEEATAMAGCLYLAQYASTLYPK